MRLIDADDLQISTEFSDDGEYSWDIVPAFRIREAPTIDAVPVVRCRDCKHFRENIDRHGGVHMHCIKSNHIPKVEAEHFCSYGERRGGG